MLICTICYVQTVVWKWNIKIVIPTVYSTNEYIPRASLEYVWPVYDKF